MSVDELSRAYAVQGLAIEELAAERDALRARVAELELTGRLSIRKHDMSNRTVTISTQENVVITVGSTTLTHQIGKASYDLQAVRTVDVGPGGELPPALTSEIIDEHVAAMQALADIYRERGL